VTLTATATQGFQLLRYTSQEEVFYLPGAVSTSYTRGNMAHLGSLGTVTEATDGDTPPLFQIHESITTPAASTAFPHPQDFDASKIGTGGKWNTLVPVKALVAPGAPVFLVALANFSTEDVAAYTAATPSVTGTTGFGADDDSNAALMYVDAGPGIGEINVCQDYVQSSKVITVLRAFETALTTASDVAVLEGAGSGAGGISLFGRADMKDANELDISDGSDDGDFVLYGDLRAVTPYLSKGQFPVIQAKYLHI